MYKLTANLALRDGQSAQIGLFNGINDQLLNATPNGEYFITLSPSASKAEPVFIATGGSGLAKAGYFKFQLLTSVYRVTTKTVSDGNNHTYTYTYSYLNNSGMDSAGVNDTVNSPNGTCDRTNTSCFEYFERFSEYRGNAQVIETGPDGVKTTTQFKQDDILKGRPTAIISNNGVADLSRVDYTYITVSLPITLNVADCSVCAPYIGVTHNWIYTDTETTTIYGSAGSKKVVDYDYETTYGNLTQKREYEGTSLYRTTTIDYFPNTTGWLVGLPARQQITDGAGVIVAETLNIYDSNTTYNQIPTAGKLSATRTWVSGANYAQTSFGYDVWGNQTSVTMYTGYGTTSLTPTTGAATTTTAYDPNYHVYPISQTTPATTLITSGLTTIWGYDYDNNGINDYILGVPTSETDPNGRKTSATYDAFGRITSLTRPLDTSPTISISYTNAYPFTTTLVQKVDNTKTYTVQRVYDGMGRQIKVISGGITTETKYVSANETWQSLPYANNETVYYNKTIKNPSAQTVTVLNADGTQTSTTTNGLITTSADTNSNITSTISDIWGRVVYVLPPNGTGPDLTYTYDSLGRLVKAIRAPSSQPDITETNPSTSGLAAWWSMNETGGTRTDSYGSNHLTDNNSVGYTTGLKNNAAVFSSTTVQSLNISDNPAISGGNTDFTIVANIYLGDTTSNRVLINKSDSAATELDYRLVYIANVGFRLRIGSETAPARVDSAAPVLPNTWHTVIAWQDSINHTINIQVDDGPVATENFSIAPMDTSQPLSIGALNTRIDEVALYRRVLTPTERTWLYNNGQSRAYAELATTPPPAIEQIPTTTISYDGAGRKTSMSDPDMGSWKYYYDAVGNLTRQKDARGQRICLYYDSLNRLTGKHYRNDDSCPTNPSLDVSYGYDSGTNGIGRRTSMTSGTITNSWTYDERGRLKAETVMGYTTEWGGYNSADMPGWMKYPGDNEVVTYGYNSRMLLESLTGSSTYVSFTGYDSAGRVTSRNLGNGLNQVFDYYDWNEKLNNVGQGGRLQTLSTGSLQNLGYEYDAAGNVKKIMDNIASETNNYGYDALNRLTSWSLNGTSESYTYDSAGNLDVKAGVDLNYNDAAHVHAATSAGSNTYAYEANGNQTTRVIGADTYTLLYDAENRLVEVKKNNVSMATFVYDGDGKRVKSTIGNETTVFVGAHYEVTGSTVTKYYYAGTQRIATRTGSTLTYLLGDHLGSTSLATSDTGTLITETRYKPWGEVRYTTPNSTLPTRYTYTGQYSYIADEATDLGSNGFGLMFYNARWYDPALGRFAQADTIVPEQSQGVQAWDRYAYVSNSPIKYDDPTGHCPVCIALVYVGISFILNGTSDSYQPNLSSNELESRQTSVQVGGATIVTAMSIESPFVETLANIYDCASGAYCGPELFAPGSTSLYTNAIEETTEEADVLVTRTYTFGETSYDYTFDPNKQSLFGNLEDTANFSSDEYNILRDIPDDIYANTPIQQDFLNDVVNSGITPKAVSNPIYPPNRVFQRVEVPYLKKSFGDRWWDQ